MSPKTTTDSQSLKPFITDDLFQTLNDSDYISFDFKPSVGLAVNGKSIFSPYSQLDYAFVPLGIITQGQITVRKHGKDTKTLKAGDYIGLFETANFLSTQKARHIGDWDLTTNSQTTIVFFTKEFFERGDAQIVNFKRFIIDKAMKDPVPQPLSDLPLLDWVAEHTTATKLDGYAIIAHTHLLPNQVPLFRHLASLVGVQRIFVISKPYSTVASAYREITTAGIEVIPIKMKPGFSYSFCVKDPIELLWHKILELRKRDSFDKMIILDDGGDVWTSIPWHKIGDLKIAGTEQTQRGISRILDSKMQLPPIVSVATSGIKKKIESYFIAKSVVSEIKKQLDLTGKKIGILGFGSIGKSIYDIMSEADKGIFIYDPSDKVVSDRKLSSIHELVETCDVIIGTTGTDSLHELPFERLQGNKILVSASSADIEFESILRFDPNRDGDSFGTLNIEIHENLSFTILGGGYPINFNRITNATPNDEIVLTRCLLYIGMMQAVHILEDNSSKASTGFYNLDTISQQKLLKKWFKDYPQIANGFSLENELENIILDQKSEFYQTRSKVWND